MSPQLSNAERERLLKVARLREKVAKTAAGERATAMIADFEQQLASCYRFDQDVTWKAAHDAADQIVEEARRKIGDRCAELGIPERFASDLGLRWGAPEANSLENRHRHHESQSILFHIQKIVCQPKIASSNPG